MPEYLKEFTKEKKQLKRFDWSSGKKPKPFKILIPKVIPTKKILDDYRCAINNAVKIAIGKNLMPINGETIVFSDTSGSMDCPISGGNELGSTPLCMDIGLILSVMMKYSCQSCDFYIFSSPKDESSPSYSRITTFNAEDLLSNIAFLRQEADKLGGGTDFPFKFWEEAIKTKRHIDLFVIFSDMMIAEGYNDISGTTFTASGIVKEYRKKVNPNMRFVSVNLSSYGTGSPIEDNKNDPLNIMISGYSDSILRFIAEIQMSQVDHIKSLKSKMN